MNGNGGVVLRLEELAGIGNTKAAELLLVKVLSLPCLSGVESFLPGPVALLENPSSFRIVATRIHRERESTE